MRCYPIGKDKTVVIISHKKEILNEVDQIVFMKDGIVYYDGDYKMFSNKSSFYS